MGRDQTQMTPLPEAIDDYVGEDKPFARCGENDVSD